MNETPRDHPTLKDHPDAPTILARIDGVLYRAPLLDRRDEQVAVRVEDVMQARAVVAQFSKLLGRLDEFDVESAGRTTTLGTHAGETPPTTREDVQDHLDALRNRLNGTLPDF